MDRFIDMLLTHFFELSITAIFAFIGYLGKKALDTYKESTIVKQEMARLQRDSEEQELIKIGILALLRFRINRLCTVIKEQEYMTIDQKLDLTDQHQAYAALGGNSRTHANYEHVMKNYKVKV